MYISNYTTKRKQTKRTGHDGREHVVEPNFRVPFVQEPRREGHEQADEEHVWDKL